MGLEKQGELQLNCLLACLCGRRSLSAHPCSPLEICSPTHLLSAGYFDIVQQHRALGRGHHGGGDYADGCVLVGRGGGAGTGVGGEHNKRHTTPSANPSHPLPHLPIHPQVGPAPPAHRYGRPLWV